MHDSPRIRPKDLFGRHTVFGALTGVETRELLKRAHTRRFQAGEVVFRRGDAGDGLYGVLTGSILIVVVSPEGRELVINKHGGGEIFGEIALLDGKGRSATAMAYEPSELLHVGREDMLAFLRAQPDAMIRIIAFICARLRRVTNLVEDSTFLNVPARLAKQIIALTRGGEAVGPSTVTLRISQSDLARMLGVSREFVGKQLVIWREAGIVELGRRRLTVRDAHALAQIAIG